MLQPMLHTTKRGMSATAIRQHEIIYFEHVTVPKANFKITSASSSHSGSSSHTPQQAYRPPSPRSSRSAPSPPLPTLNISGAQSRSIHPDTTFPSFAAAALRSLRSSRSRFPSARFAARTHAVWSSRRMRPSPGPVFAEPGLGKGIEYIVPRVLNWKFFFRWTWRTGVSEFAFGEEMVTEARSSVGFPQLGQNLREVSLQILFEIGVK